MQTAQLTQRKQKIQNIVLKSKSEFLKQVIANKSGYDLDIVIAVHLELQRRETP